MIKIYKITNKINGKIYVGQTSKTLEKRLITHKADANHKKKQNKTTILFYNAINKYEIKNFYIELIEEVDEEIADKMEMFYIKKFNSRDKNIGYNITEGGGGTKGHAMYRERNGFFGKHHTQETKYKISSYTKGKKIEDFCDKETVERLKQYYKDRYIGNKNPFYKEIDFDKDLDWILNEKFLEKECKNKIGVCYITLLKKFKEKYGKNIQQYRKDNGIRIDRKYKKKIKHSKNTIEKVIKANKLRADKNHPFYKEINLDLLKDMILNGEKVYKICEVLNISDKVYYSRKKLLNL